MWFHPSIVKHPLIYVVQNISHDHLCLKIKDLWDDGRSIIVELNLPLSPEIVASVQELEPTIITSIVDTWVWKDNLNGEYTVKSAYHWLLSRRDDNVSTDKWDWIRKLPLSASVQFFIWQVCHNSIPTKYILQHRGVNVSATCPCCNGEDEYIHHCLVLCPRAVAVWSECGFSDVSSLCDNNILSNMGDIIRMLISKIGSVAPIIMWNLWCTRNKLVFDGIQPIVSNTISVVYAQLQVSRQAFNNIVFTALVRPTHEVCWQHGDKDTMVLNVNDNALTNPGKAGYGGLVRNFEGRFQFAFYGSVGLPNILHAEIHAIMIGIKLSWEVGYKKLVCFSDSLHVVQLVSKDVSRLHHYANLLELIRVYSVKEWEIFIHHIFREGNSCADIIAKLGANQPESLVMVHQPLLELSKMGRANGQVH